jgi:gas vesicle protein
MRRLFSFFTGALVGGLIGSGLVLLFTPYRGDELRGELISRLDSLGNEINQARMNKRIELETQLAVLRAPKPKQ